MMSTKEAKLILQASQISGAWASVGHCDRGEIILEGLGLAGVPK